MYSFLQHLDSNLRTITFTIWTVTYVQLLQNQDSNLRTITYTIWTVTYVQLLQNLDSNLCKLHAPSEQ